MDYDDQDEDEINEALVRAAQRRSTIRGFKGYARGLGTTEQLVSAVRTALTVNPNQRLGQLLVNALGSDVDLFQILDEDLAAKLASYREGR